jgi:NhaP-type Na+/H+ or K+/H+ antiporter
MYLVGGLIVSGAGIQGVQAIFLFAARVCGDVCGTCPAAEGIYLAFCLIVATLVFQGLSLPWLIRRLGLSDPGRMKDEEQEARRILLREALVHLDRKRSKNRDQSAMFGELIASYQQRLDAMPVERDERVRGLVDQARGVMRFWRCFRRSE